MKNCLSALFLILPLVFCVEKPTGPAGYTRGDFLGKWSWYNQDSTYSEHYEFTDSGCSYSIYFPSPPPVHLIKQSGVYGRYYSSWACSDDSVNFYDNGTVAAKHECSFLGKDILLVCYDSLDLWDFHPDADRCVKYSRE